MIIIDGPAANGMGEKIATKLGARHFKTIHKTFPDGESYIKMPKLPRGGEAIVVQSTYSPQDKHLMELFFMADALNEMGFERITAVVPYLAYVRQNKSFTENEAVSIKMVMHLLNSSGISTLVTVEPHRYDALLGFKGKTKIIDPSAAFAREISANTKRPFVIATDEGDMGRAERLAGLLGCESDYIEKERNLVTNEVSVKREMKKEIRGRDAVIFDDVISTGGTIELAAKMASSMGASKVIAAAAHLIMAGNAYERIASAGVSELYGANTIPFPKAHAVDVSGEIAEALKDLSF